MLSTDALYLIFFTTGFSVGFGHCIGMCGPIAVSFSLNLKGKSILLSHGLYNTGRLLTYAILGGLMGAAGSFTAVSARIAGLQQGAMIAAGVLVMVMGLALNEWLPFVKYFRRKDPAGGIFSKGFHKLTAIRSPYAYFPIGLLLGLLPCGPVYTALVAAAGTGIEAPGTLYGFLSGAGLMAAFGLGTVPALILVARLAGIGWLTSRRLICRLGSILMILVGIIYVIKGVRY
ncbi:MAG: sulfite exporter TauE/SafE family protein [Thermodesulfobacteriota bacterium]